MTRFDPLPPTPCLIDTHCHLDAAEFDDERDEVLRRASAEGVGQLLVPAIAASNFDAVLALRERHGCWVALGLHPIYLDSHHDDHLAALDAALTAHRPQALGEIGLDYFVPDLDPARQEALFVEQLKLARKHGLPVVLHVRRSVDRILKHLREQRVEAGIAHAFNGSRQQADAMIAQGFKLGFGGAMTYSGSRRIRELAATLPLSALVLETDAPDIRPQFAQDRPNEPANVAAFAQELSRLRNLPLLPLQHALYQNSLRALRL